MGDYRQHLEGIRVRGQNVAKPLKTWNQTGISNKIIQYLKKIGILVPMPIQAQAIPVIMSGRDCIGIAKTGSGKTLAFVLPMIRHVKDQVRIDKDEGPISIIMAPTRELVNQIDKNIKRLAIIVGLKTTCVYGG